MGRDSKAKKAPLGVEAVLWGEAWTSLKGPFQDHDVVAIAVNQIREVIETGGGPKKRGWGGKKTTTPRGKALKFYAWVRVEMKGFRLEDGAGNAREDVDGITVRMRVIKNKTSPDRRGMVEYGLVRGEGFDLLSDTIALALECGAVAKKGNWFCLNGENVANGRRAFGEFLVGKPKILALIEKRVAKHVAGGEK